MVYLHIIGIDYFVYFLLPLFVSGAKEIMFMVPALPDFLRYDCR
jgi:hypothetical protein